MAEPLSLNGSPPQKEPEYYKNLKNQFGSFINGNEILPAPSLIETVNARKISLLTTDVKTRKLIAVKREVMKEALKNLQISAKILARCSNAMWDIVLVTEDAAKSLADCILTTKTVRLQTEYSGMRKSKVTLHRVYLYRRTIWAFTFLGLGRSRSLEARLD